MIEREPTSPLGVVLGRLVAAWDEGADVVGDRLESWFVGKEISRCIA